MKKTLLVAVCMLLLVILTTPGAKAQEWSPSLDIYSSYIWRGAKFGNGPAFQPGVAFTSGGFSIGAWGSVSSSLDEGFEMDLYAGYEFALGESSTLGITLTDYYFGGDWTEYSMNHYIEPSVSLGIGGFSLMGAAMFMAEVEGAAAVPESPAMVDLNTGVITEAVEGEDAVEAVGFGENVDLYFEAGYSFENFSLGVGAGNNQYTSDGEFGICNINIGTSKEIEITEKFTLPVSGAIILNPSTGGFYITVGISL